MHHITTDDFLRRGSYLINPCSDIRIVDNLKINE